MLLSLFFTTFDKKGQASCSDCAQRLNLFCIIDFKLPRSLTTSRNPMTTFWSIIRALEELISHLEDG